MYERNIIVIEKYLEKILGTNKKSNVKLNYENFKNLVKEIEEFNEISIQEKNIIEKFDECVKEIESIQKKQDKLIQTNSKLEQTRNSLFYDLGDETKDVEQKFVKIEENIEKNNIELKELRSQFISFSTEFAENQKERNKCEKAKRISETNYIAFVKKVNEDFHGIEIQSLKDLKEFLFSDKEEYNNEIFDIIVKNGKNEKVKFDKNVIKKAIDNRIKIFEKEIESYLIAYDKTKRILIELENESLKLEKYKKALRDINIKLSFINVEKEYLATFLDYERLSSMSGAKVHESLMIEACESFELDISQIDNLYQLLIKEITNKSTKKAYNELYNKTYLQEIEEKEKHFEKEANNIKTNIATVINTSYWRIEGIKNIYNTFIDEVTSNFNKDLSEYRNEPVEEQKISEVVLEEDILEKKLSDTEIESNEAEEFVFKEDYDEIDDDEEDENYEDEDYEDEDYEDEEFEEDDEDEDYEDEEFEEDDEDEEDEDYEHDEYDEQDDNEEIDIDRIFDINKDEDYEEDNEDKDNKEKEQESIFEDKRVEKNSSQKKQKNIFGNIFGKKNKK